MVATFDSANTLADATPERVRTEIPVRLDARFLQLALRQEVFTESNQSATVWDDGSGCNDLILRQPNIEIVEGRIRLLAKGTGRVGRPISHRSCLAALDWDGYFEAWVDPYISTDGRAVAFRVSESSLLDDSLHQRIKPSLIWHWARRWAHPEIEKVTLELHPIVESARDIAAGLISPEHRDGLDQVLEDLSIGDLRYDRNSIIVDLNLDIDATNFDTPIDGSDALTQSDVTRLWQAWDGFLTHTIRHAARATEARKLRARLFDVMLSARHRLDVLLGQPTPPANSDFRELFVDYWRALAPVVNDIAADVSVDSPLNFVSFIAAGDLLSAIDAQGSRLGVEVSVAGLRRLAAAIPGSRADEDPIAFSYAVDTDLRTLFGFGPPLSLPGQDTGGDRYPSWDGGLLNWLERLIPAAYAGGLDNDRLLVARLNRWIVDADNARSYVPLVDKLLDQTAWRVLEREALEKEFHEIYRPLVAATAWQESCFRQFISRDGERQTLTSSAGAVGLMQIRPVVWRGFYEPKSLKNDIAYNATAGAEILLRYMVRYAVGRDEHLKDGGRDNLAAATYAAYNGGPRRSTRYRDPSASSRTKRVDNAFAEKFRSIRDGNRAAPLTCFGITDWDSQ